MRPGTVRRFRIHTPSASDAREDTQPCRAPDAGPGDPSGPRDAAPRMCNRGDAGSVADNGTSAPEHLVALHVDPDVLEFFTTQGGDYRTRMNAALRAWMQAQLKR